MAILKDYSYVSFITLDLVNPFISPKKIFRSFPLPDSVQYSRKHNFEEIIWSIREQIRNGKSRDVRY